MTTFNILFFMFTRKYFLHCAQNLDEFTMKKHCLVFFCTIILGLSMFSVAAQEPTETSADNKENNEMVSGENSTSEEEENPLVFKFEPNLIAENKERKEAIAKMRAKIDSLDISDRKRFKLLKDLYKNGASSKNLKKALLVDVKFENN